jgi:hypothetical protein
VRVAADGTAAFQRSVRPEPASSASQRRQYIRLFFAMSREYFPYLFAVQQSAQSGMTASPGKRPT